jgi:alpha-amylase
MGECLKAEPEIVGPYQQHVTSVFNVPMYHIIKDVFGERKDSMLKINSMFKREEKLFKNVDILGLFVDNHDMARFLSDHYDPISFESALIFSLTARGIPFFYYGSEFGYSGGNDP